MQMKRSLPLSGVEKRALEKARTERDWAEQRFPLLFGIAATFGLVATLYGFEKLIDKSELLSENPWILLATGLVTLLVTGAAYRKLN
jgi:hypothetical protein